MIDDSIGSVSAQPGLTLALRSIEKSQTARSVQILASGTLFGARCGGDWCRTVMYHQAHKTGNFFLPGGSSPFLATGHKSDVVRMHSIVKSGDEAGITLP
jgi:hypothetical protein